MHAATLPLLPRPPAQTDAPVLVGLSGGLDSVVLLHHLAQCRRIRRAGLRAVHVHHGLQAAADDWLLHCQTLCQNLKVDFSYQHVKVATDSKLGLEAAARQARHAVFAEQLQTGEVLALAHHQDDQAETFLLRALRGAGVDGLAAMRPWRSYAQGWLWRPFLACTRAQIQAYASAQQLHWCEDNSNADTRFNRNWLRQQLLPPLQQRFLQASRNFARSADLCAQASTLLRQHDAHALALARTLEPHFLRIAPLQQLHSAQRARVLRLWLDTLNLPPLPAEGIAQLQMQMLDTTTRSDRAFCFDWHGARIQRWQDLLYAHRPCPPLPTDFAQYWDGSSPLDLPHGARLQLLGASALPQPVWVHARQGGERLWQKHSNQHHSVKKILQQHRIPPWLRLHLPLLSLDKNAADSVQAIADIAYSSTLDNWLTAHTARLHWQPPSNNRKQRTI